MISNIIVVYNTVTMEAITVAPIAIESGAEVALIELDGIVKDGFDYIICNGTEPLFKDIKDDMVILDDKKILLNPGYL